MRFEEVYQMWTIRRLSQEEAAHVLGVCERTFRRYIAHFAQIKVVICLQHKYYIPIITTLNDMLRLARKVKTRQTRHLFSRLNGINREHI